MYCRCRFIMTRPNFLFVCSENQSFMDAELVELIRLAAEPIILKCLD